MRIIIMEFVMVLLTCLALPVVRTHLHEPLATHKVCADPDCSVLMYEATAVQDYIGPDCRFLSFQVGAELLVYHVLWAHGQEFFAGIGMLPGSKFGYFPRNAIRVGRNFVDKEVILPTQVTDFECDDNEEEIYKGSEDVSAFEMSSLPLRSSEKVDIEQAGALTTDWKNILNVELDDSIEDNKHIVSEDIVNDKYSHEICTPNPNYFGYPSIDLKKQRQSFDAAKESFLDKEIYQSHQEVDKAIDQSRQEVDKAIDQSRQEVDKEISQSHQEVDKAIDQSFQEVGKAIDQRSQGVGKSIVRSSQVVDREIYQSKQEFLLDVKAKIVSAEDDEAINRESHANQKSSNTFDSRAVMLERLEEYQHQPPQLGKQVSQIVPSNEKEKIFVENFSERRRQCASWDALSGAGVASRHECQVLGLVSNIPKPMMQLDFWIILALTWLQSYLLPASHEEVTASAQPSKAVSGMFLKALACLFPFIFVLLFIRKLIRFVRNKNAKAHESKIIILIRNVLNLKHTCIEDIVHCQTKLELMEKALQEALLREEAKGSDITDRKALSLNLQQKKAMLTGEKEVLQTEVAILKQKKTETQTSNGDSLQLEELRRFLEERLQSVNCEQSAANLEESEAQRKLESLQRRIKQLSDATNQLLQDNKSWCQRHGDLSEEIQSQTQQLELLREVLQQRNSEVQSLRDCLKQFREIGLDIENIQNNNDERKVADETNNNNKKEAFHGLLNLEKVTATLEIVKKERARLKEKFNEEIVANKKLEDILQSYSCNNSRLKADDIRLKKDLDFSQKKLEIMTEMYKDKEVILQRKLVEEEQMRQRNEVKLSQADEELLQKREETNIFREKAETYREEIKKLEESYKEQLSDNEKKVHENWLSARTSERDLLKARRDVINLRERLAELDLKLALVQSNDFLPLPHVPPGAPAPYGPPFGGVPWLNNSFTTTPSSIPPSPPRLTDEPRQRTIPGAVVSQRRGGHPSLGLEAAVYPSQVVHMVDGVVNRSAGDDLRLRNKPREGGVHRAPYLGEATWLRGIHNHSMQQIVPSFRGPCLPNEPPPFRPYNAPLESRNDRRAQPFWGHVVVGERIPSPSERPLGLPTAATQPQGLREPSGSRQYSRRSSPNESSCRSQDHAEK
uniref:melanoma inhibitory activity protein 2-like isoform X2 n=1 Tax=Myxine glutinosa TaxID=7769 RepID=UPI00358FC65F